MNVSTKKGCEKFMIKYNVTCSKDLAEGGISSHYKTLRISGGIPLICRQGGTALTHFVNSLRDADSKMSRSSRCRCVERQ